MTEYKKSLVRDILKVGSVEGWYWTYNKSKLIWEEVTIEDT
jgi:hypothetical protein